MPWSWTMSKLSSRTNYLTCSYSHTGVSTSGGWVMIWVILEGSFLIISWMYYCTANAPFFSLNGSIGLRHNPHFTNSTDQLTSLLSDCDVRTRNPKTPTFKYFTKLKNRLNGNISRAAYHRLSLRTALNQTILYWSCNRQSDLRCAVHHSRLTPS